MFRIFLIICALFLAGCSTNKYQLDKGDPTVVKLLQVAKSIEKYNRDLSHVMSSKYKIQDKNTGAILDPDLLPAANQVVSLGYDWHGPIEPLISKLSEVAGLNAPRFVNVRPSNAIVVSVDTDYRRVVDILADAGAQAGSRANIILKVKEQLIEVEYLYYD